VDDSGAERAESITPPQVLEVYENAEGRPPWALSLYADRLELSKDGRVVSIARADLVKRAELIDGVILRRLLAVKLDSTSSVKTLFLLDSEGFSQLRRWYGPPTRRELGRVLREKLSPTWTVPVGLLWAFLALPRRADPEAGAGATALDGPAFGLGLSLFALGVLSRVVRHRVLLLGYAFWFAAFSAYCVLNVMRSGSVIAFVLAVVGVAMASGGLGHYYRFATLAGEEPRQA
jgi:hypothetical protein